MIVKSVPFGWVSAVQVVVDVDGIVEHLSPVEDGIGLDLVREALEIEMRKGEICKILL